MNSNDYNLDINISKGEAHYSRHSGYSRSFVLDYNSITSNPDILSDLNGTDGFMLASILGAKEVGNLHFSIRERRYKYLTLIAVLFATLMMISNILSTKLMVFYGFTVAGAMLVYPLTYVFDYILTDVYGYQNTRRVILSTFLCLCLFDLSLILLVYSPPSPFWVYQNAIEETFIRMLRTFVSSTVVFGIAFFVSSYVFQKIKVKTEGKYLFKRVFYSLVVSEIIETWAFCFLSFYGVWPLAKMANYMLVSFFIKVTYELIVYGIITQPLVQFIKKEERLDIIDKRTNFNPLSWEVRYTEKDNFYSKEGGSATT